MQIELSNKDIRILLDALSKNPTEATFSENAYMHQKLIKALAEDLQRLEEMNETLKKEGA